MKNIPSWHLLISHFSCSSCGSFFLFVVVVTKRVPKLEIESEQSYNRVGGLSVSIT